MPFRDDPKFKYKLWGRGEREIVKILHEAYLVLMLKVLIKRMNWFVCFFLFLFMVEY